MLWCVKVCRVAGKSHFFVPHHVARTPCIDCHLQVHTYRNVHQLCCAVFSYVLSVKVHKLNCSEQHHIVHRLSVDNILLDLIDHALLCYAVSDCGLESYCSSGHSLVFYV